MLEHFWPCHAIAQSKVGPLATVCFGQALPGGHVGRRKRQVIALRQSVAVPANTALQRFQMVVTRLQLPGD